MHALKDLKLAVIGLGYVGLPLAVEFGRHRPVLGFDLEPERVSALRAGDDETRDRLDSLIREFEWAFPETAAELNTVFAGRGGTE